VKGNLTLLVTVGTVLIHTSLFSQNLLSNGSFELGNVGFFSGYNYTPASNQNPGEYAVVSNPNPWNAGAFSMVDHTSGTGLMLALNGSSLSTDILWRQIVSVQPNTTYLFSGWAASWGVFGGGNTDPSPANLRISVEGVQLGDRGLPQEDGIWQQFTLQWSSGAATQATIEIRDLNTAFLGNDFALDDLSFTAVPEPCGVWLFALGTISWAVCRRHPNSLRETSR
jgi:hypothetical protein